ncbi:MAG: hypothetical protein WC916_05010 [Candidatus Woesearchaeota archaeon]
MGTITETQISIYGKDGPNYNLFTKILDKIDIPQIKTAYIHANHKKKFNALFRAAYGFDYEDGYIQIYKPTKKDITDLTGKLWNGLNDIHFSREKISDFSSEDNLSFTAYASLSEIICRGEPLNARAKKIISLGYKEFRKIVSISADIPELIPKKSIDAIQDIIKVFHPSDNHCADLRVLRNDAGRNQILTLEELSEKLDKYKMKP